MTQPDMRHTDPRRLASLLDFSSQRLWEPSELGSILRHQMTAPVEFDLTALGDERAGKVRTLATAGDLVVRSFSDLLFHPHPPLELLELTKQFAKASHVSPGSPLPREIARVLYLSSIVAAQVRCGTRITALTDAALSAGLRWAMQQPWVDEKLRLLLAEGLGALKEQDKPVDEGTTA